MKPWAEYVTEHRAFIRWHVARRTPDRHVEDVTQTAIERALRLEPRYRDDDANRGWLAMIAFNAVRDHYKHHARRPTEPLGDDDRYANVVPFDEALEQRDDLVRRLGQLTPVERTRVLLAGCGFSPAEIGERTGVTSGMARKAVSLARTKARQMKEAA